MINREYFDEMWFSDGGVRQHYMNFHHEFSLIPISTIIKKEEIIKNNFLKKGITFSVYSDNEGAERIFPFDIIPRIIRASEWHTIEKGIKQRIIALNKFLYDIYHERNIISDNIIPKQLIASCPHYNREVFGIDVPYDIYTHISGIDLIRDTDGTYYVLEDNLRTPSGVSYMLEDREVSKMMFPELMQQYSIKSIAEYPLLLKNILVSLSPSQNSPRVVILTPGIYNSAYYEHVFLAKYMGCEIVEGRDLLVKDHKVYMKTTEGLQRVDVIYRRVDEEYLDPLVFLKDSFLGVPGLLSAYRKKNVAIVNAIGNGIADDKAIYAYVPDMIRYYLNEDPILKNVPTYSLTDPDHQSMAFKNMNNMVIKKTNDSGGYGMLIGNTATDAAIAEMKQNILLNPRSYIAQPIIKLSTVPCFIDGKLSSRHVDLRPYALYGPEGVKIVPGGLTRVALVEGSLIVNSSQGGGSKDTWIVEGY